MRQRIDRRRLMRSPYKLIADIADGQQALWLAGVVLNLLANPAHMHIYRAHIADERRLPELGQQLRAAEDLAGMAHEEVQQGKGARLKHDPPLAALGDMSGWIDHQISSPQAAGWP